ncbi:ATP-binding protein [Muricoccus radiodurans]|uniref:ATP-binding protein n=1 Tax=Muricoccus radiodurans TaxID=2231721 RepID=UPI003CEAA146
MTDALRDTRAALAASRREAADLRRRLAASERRLAARQATLRPAGTAADEETALGAALEDLWALADELEESNLALAAEVTERRSELERIDAALRQSEERLRLAHRYAGTGAWDWHIRDGTVAWSEELSDLLGVDPAAPATYATWLQAVLPEDRDAVQAAVDACLRQGRPECELEYRIRHPDRGIRWLAGRGRLERDVHGNPFRITGLCIDITARKMAELALRDMNENLRREVEREVAAREAAQARLTQTLKLEALGRLTGGVAHDFNNLLAVVTAGTSLLAHAEDAAKRQRILDSIAGAARRGADLTRRLLTFARRQALKPEPVDLRTWLEEVRDLLARSLREDIAIEIDVAEDLWPVLADPSEMELALLNLAFNARDAMPRGGTLRLTAHNVALAPGKEPDLRGEFLCFQIRDSGVGMTPEALARAFEPFFTTKPKGHGSGLGLAQVYGFAKQSGGVARVASTPGEGTTVSLLLPRATAEPTHQAATASEPARDTPLRILVVEDDDAVAALVLDMLQHLGHTVLRAATAAAALKLLDDELSVDLVFTDVMMPGGADGLDLAREVERHRPGLPVLLTSGYGGAPARVAAAGLPLLRKPYDLEALRAALREAVAPRR